MTFTVEMESEIPRMGIEELWNMYSVQFLDADQNDKDWRTEHGKVKNGFQVPFSIYALIKNAYDEFHWKNRTVRVYGYGDIAMDAFNDEVQLRKATMMKRIRDNLTNPSVLVER